MSQKTDAPTTQEARGPGISACIIVRNEEQMLPECLASIRPWVEQICVIDMKPVLAASFQFMDAPTPRTQIQRIIPSGIMIRGSS